MNSKQLKGGSFDHDDILKHAVKTARSAGAKAAIAKTLENTEHQIRWSNSAIDISKQWNTCILELFLTKRRRIDVLTIRDPTIEKINEMVPKKIKSLCKLPRTLLYWGMTRKKHTAPQINALYDPKSIKFYERAPKVINDSIDAALSKGAKKVAGALYFGHRRTGVLTSKDNGGVYDSSYYQFTIRSFVDAESSGQQNVVGRNLDDVDSKFISGAKKSGEIAAQCVGGEQGKAGKYDVILSPTVAANIFGYLLDGANPVYMIGKMSCLSKKMNKKVAPESISVSDNGRIPEGLNSRPFDFEGYPSQETPLIKDGRFVGMIHNTSTARIWKLLGRFRTKTTGNSFLGSVVMGDYGPKVLAPLPTNRVFDPGSIEFDEMVADSKKPTIYVTSNWYTRFTNNLEGVFSTIPRDGIFLIENGQIQKSIRKIRIADALPRMLRSIIAVGNDVKQIRWWEVETPTFIPHLKIKDVPITAATK